MSDNQTPTPSDFSHFYPTETVVVNKALWEKYCDLVNNTDDFLGAGESPVEAIHHLLLRWLPSVRTEEPKSFDNKRIETLLNLCAFLFEMQGELRDLRFCETEVQKQQPSEREGANHD